uniref:Uncharacterized protein n=1 Tax=Anguilla anguilla TaxID=7936 RepID=A0A0E9WDG1_ANGAN
MYLQLGTNKILFFLQKAISKIMSLYNQME